MGMVEEATKMRVAWERHEARIVRPFKSGQYLSDTKFRLYRDGDLVEGPAIQLDQVDRNRLGVALRISAPPRNFGDLVGLAMKDLALIVSIEDRLMKNALIVYRTPLSDVEAGIIELEEDIRDRFSWAGETRIHISVVLAKSRKAKPGTASRAGNWLAKKTFSIRKTTDSAVFRLTPVSSEYFRQRGLPSNTAYLVDIHDTDFNQSCENLPDLVKVCVHEDVYSALARDEDSNVAKALIKNIYVDVVSTILSTGFSDLTDEMEPNGILDTVAKRITKNTGITPQKLKQFASENGSAQLRAVIQSETDLGRSLIAAATRRWHG